MSAHAKLVRAFSGKTVLVTGHTRFKGSWLTVWLRRLGAKVIGLSLDIQTQPSHFEVLKLAAGIDDHRIDVRRSTEVLDLMSKVRPDIVFHLAAQPLVRRSYRAPLESFETNTLVNNVVTIPMSNVTAKPRTGPVPKYKSTTAPAAVVMFESRIADIARL